MRRIGKKGLACLVFFVIIHLIKNTFTSFMLDQYGEGRIEIYLEEPVMFNNFVLQDGYEKLMPIVLGEKQMIVGEKKQIKVTATGTNSYFPMLERLQWVDGTFWGKGAMEEGRNVVVISDRLSSLLFGSKQATGNVCKIGSEYYQIVGIYKRYAHFSNFLWDRGEEVVYFPITSAIGKDMDIEAVWLPGNQGEQPIGAKELMTLGIHESNSIIYHGEDAYRRLEAFVQAGISIAGIIFVGYCTLHSMRCLKKQHRSRRIKILYIGSVLALGSLVGVMCIKRFYIPTVCLPPYNIFDWKYYWEYFREQLILHQKVMRLQFTYFEAVYWQLRGWSFILTVIQIFLSVFISGWVIEQITIICEIEEAK